MSSEKVLSSGSASASASAPLASTHAEVCKGINGLNKVVLRDPRGSSAEVPNLTINMLRFFFHICDWICDFVLEIRFRIFVKSRA